MDVFASILFSSHPKSFPFLSSFLVLFFSFLLRSGASSMLFSTVGVPCRTCSVCLFAFLEVYRTISVV